MTLGTLAIPLRAANESRAGKAEQTTVLWTNEELEKLRPLGLISVIGQASTAEVAATAAPRQPDVNTQDPEWYAEQAAKLRTRLESAEDELQRYRQAIEDAKSLKTTTGGMNLEEGDIGVTPEAGVEILQQRVNETQSELDALEDLARRNDIPPGTLRSQ